ncbi:MAG: 2-oxo acid dehydrogenase subunit E2 [DPANN group archaeon]|nr:2-oxo acid dehydrogenase subunit E2 [DPANN group archaeon]
MGIPFNFPDVGEGIVEGKLVKWHVKEGELVRKDSTLAEVETDKAIVEIPSPRDGTIEKLPYQEGDTLTVGKPLLVFTGKGDDQETAQTAVSGTGERALPDSPAVSSEKEKQPEKSQPPQHTGNPQPTTRETSDDVIALPSVRKFAAQHGIDLTKVRGTGRENRITLEDVQQQAGSATPSVPKVPRQFIGRKDPPEKRTILATPSLRRYAREQGIGLETVKGSGLLGRVTKEDIDHANGRGGIEGKPSTSLKLARAVVASPKVTGPAEVIPLTAIRRAIAKKMTESLEKAAQVTHSDEADVTGLVKVREHEKAKLAKQGIHLTYLPFFVKAAVSALQKHPLLNATLDEGQQAIILKKYYHVGIAVDTPEGLLVPVVKDADRKSIDDLAREIGDLAARARAKKLTPAEMHDSTFSISSVGRFGGQVFTPILNYPEAALLGIGRILEKPGIVDGKIVPRKMVTLSLTYDHRILDGAEAARFISTLIQYLEDPDLFMVEMP